MRSCHRKWINFVLCGLLIGILGWQINFIWLEVALRYRNHDFTRTLELNTAEKMLTRTLRTMSFTELSKQLHSDQSRGFGDGIVYMTPNLQFIGQTGRTYCASITRGDFETSQPLTSVLRLKTQSWTFSRATLRTPDFRHFLVVEILWVACISVLLLQRRFLSGLWEKNQGAFVLWCLLNAVIAILFIRQQPAPTGYAVPLRSRSPASFAEAFLREKPTGTGVEQRSADGISYLTFRGGSDFFPVPFQWLELSPFDYLYRIDGDAKAVLPTGDDEIAVTPEPNGLYRVTYVREKNFATLGLLPGILLVWLAALVGLLRVVTFLFHPGTNASGKKQPTTEERI